MEEAQLSETRQMNVVGLPKEYSLAVVATDKDTENRVDGL